MIIRKYMQSDCKFLYQLFYDTVHTINAKDYTKEQLKVWAAETMNMEQWDKSFLEHITFVAIEDEIIIGFGDIDRTGYLDRLYVHKEYQRRGVAAAICNKMEDYVKCKKMITHASITAKGFFEKRGFKVVKKQQVEKNGIYLTNFVMEKKFKI